MKTRFITMTSVALLASQPGWAQAQANADADGDGSVTLAEYQTAVLEAAERRFEALDENGDGVLSGNELNRRGDRDSGNRVQIDADGDGFLSLAEVQAARSEFTIEQFNAIDTNGDGLLSEDERREARANARDDDDADDDDDRRRGGRR